MDHLEVRLAERFDAADVAAVLSAAALGSRQVAFLDLTLGAEEACTILVWDAGRPVATALALAFGESGWIANVAVVPDYRRRGIGSRVAERALGWLTERRVTTVTLLATEHGRPVYERLGFVSQGLAYEKYRIPAGLAPKGPTAVRGLELARALALDLEATGERRDLLLRPFADRLVEPVAGDAGWGAGYALALPWGGGSVVSATEEGAHALWWHVFGRAPGARWAVSPENEGARALAARYGLRPDGTSLRMRYGPPIAGQGPARVWAVWSLATG